MFVKIMTKYDLKTKETIHALLYLKQRLLITILTKYSVTNQNKWNNNVNHNDTFITQYV